MATFRDNLELLSPEEGDTDIPPNVKSRNNAISFLGFKTGQNDFNDVTSGVGPTTHYKNGGGAGEGLNDVTIGGVYAGSSSIVYQVMITQTGTPDEFQFSADNGSSWNGHNIEIDNSNGPQALSNGINVFFENTTGHISGDYWTSSVNQVASTLTDPIKMGLIEVSHEGHNNTGNQARLRLRVNDGGAPTSSSLLINNTGTATSADLTPGGNYTGPLDGVRTYYVKVTDTSTNPEKWSWSTDNVNYSEEFEMAGHPTAQTLEHGVTVIWTHTQSGKFPGDIYTFTVGQEGVKIHANGDFQSSGTVVSKHGFQPNIYNVSGTLLNSYS